MPNPVSRNDLMGGSMAEAAINVNPVHTVVLRAGGMRTRACQTVRLSISDLKTATYYVRRLQNLLRRFCKRSIQKPEFSIQNGNPLSGRVISYSDSCILTPDFSLANTPEGFCKSLTSWVARRQRPTAKNPAGTAPDTFAPPWNVT